MDQREMLCVLRQKYCLKIERIYHRPAPSKIARRLLRGPCHLTASSASYQSSSLRTGSRQDSPIGQELSLLRLALRWLRNHPQPVAIQDINEISFVLKPLDDSRELLHHSRSGWIRQIPKYEVIIGCAAVHGENLAFGNDRQVTRQVHPARYGWIRPRDYSNGFRLSGLADIDNRDTLVFGMLHIEVVFVVHLFLDCHVNSR